MDMLMESILMAARWEVGRCGGMGEEVRGLRSIIGSYRVAMGMKSTM